MKRAWQNLALLATSLTILLVVGEIAVRLLYFRIADYNSEMWRYASEVKVRTSNPKLPFVHGASRSGDFYGAKIQTNSHGFRDREYPVERVPGRTRIMMIGDSFTLGWGVPFDSTYSKQLELLLNASGSTTEVINTGVGNYNTVMEVELFKQGGLRFHPDAVILMYFVNDAEPTPPVVSAMKATVVTRSYLIAFLIDHLYIKLKPRLDQDYDWKSYYGNLYRPGEPGFVAGRQALLELIGLCRERGIKLLIASIPELRELKEYPFPQATEFVRTLSTEQGVPFLDLRSALVNEDPATLWVTREDPHANGQANVIIARALHDAITRTGLLGTPRRRGAH